MQDEVGRDSRKHWDRPRLSRLATELAELGTGIRTEGTFGAIVS